MEAEEYKTVEAKINAFKSELKAVIDKYNFSISELDNYDSEENYTNTSYYLVVDGHEYYTEDLEAIIKDLI